MGFPRCVPWGELSLHIGEQLAVADSVVYVTRKMVEAGVAEKPSKRDYVKSSNVNVNRGEGGRRGVGVFRVWAAQLERCNEIETTGS